MEWKYPMQINFHKKWTSVSWSQRKPGNVFHRDAKNICFKISKSDFKNQILGAKISKMLIFHYISYKFDKISHLKNQIWHWKISILPDLTSQNQHFSEKSADLAPLGIPLVGVIYSSQNSKKFTLKKTVGIVFRIHSWLLLKNFFVENGFLEPYILSLQNHQ